MRATLQLLILTGVMMTSTAHGEVPENIKNGLSEIGRVVIDPSATADLYRSLHSAHPTADAQITRDISYGPNPRNMLDVFRPGTAKNKARVLVFVTGGMGDRNESFPNGEPYYDNVMYWATAQQMVAVKVGRRGVFVGDENGDDVGTAVRWIHDHIAEYGGDADRVFIWGYSAGAMSLADYLSREQFQAGKGTLVAGAVLMSGPYNLDPITVPDDGGLKVRLAKDGPILSPPPTDPALVVGKSVVPGMKALTTPLMLLASERDPDLLLNSTLLLNDELNKAGKPHAFKILKYHNHSSEIFSVNTGDTSATAPILEWINSVERKR